MPAASSPAMLGGAPSEPTQLAPQLRSGPGCPRCRNRWIWLSWIDVASRCPRCSLDLHRHGWLAAMWIETWITIAMAMTWIVVGLIATRGAGPAWVTIGAVAIAIVTPPASYRYAKAAMLRLLHQLDPPDERATGTRR